MTESSVGASDDAPPAPASDRWWPKRAQPDWLDLPAAAVDWLVVWNVNLGGGKQAFSVDNKYWGNHPFRPNQVPPGRAYVWHADDARPPFSTPTRGFGGIPSLIALTIAGVPISSGTILLPDDDTVDAAAALARAVDDAVTARGGAWCPALVGVRSAPRLGISVQRAARTDAAEFVAGQLAIDDIVIVDVFGERGHADATTPKVVIRGNRDGTHRRALAGDEGLADVELPPEVRALSQRDSA